MNHEVLAELISRYLAWEVSPEEVTAQLVKARVELARSGFLPLQDLPNGCIRPGLRVVAANANGVPGKIQGVITLIEKGEVFVHWDGYPKDFDHFAFFMTMRADLIFARVDDAFDALISIC